MPRLVELQEEYGPRGLQVVLLTQEGEAELRRAELDRLPVTFLVDATPVFERFDVRMLPHTFYFSADGRQAEEFEGLDYAALERIRTRLRTYFEKQGG